MALTKEEATANGKKAAANWTAQRRNDPKKMRAWKRAIRRGQLRWMREKKRARKLADSQTKETPVANRKAKHWTSNRKRILAAAKKTARTKKRMRRERERELTAQEAQRRVVEHHSPDDLVHLNFPVVAGQPVRVTNGGHDGDDLTITPTVRKQLALEGLRFVKILLE